MKNLNSFLLITLFLITNLLNAKSTIILNSTRSDGFLGLFGSVSQTYMGEIGRASAYDLNCSGYGLNRCRVHTLSNPALSPEMTFLYNFALPFVNDMEDDIEDEVDFGILTGTLSQNFARDLDGDGVYDKLVTITGTWNALDADFNDGSSTITINEIDYPY